MATSGAAVAGVSFLSAESGSAPPIAAATAAYASSPLVTRPCPLHPVSTRMRLTSSAVRLGLQARIIAATPDTSGAAIDVPPCVDPVKLAPSGPMGTLVPGATG